MKLLHLKIYLVFIFLGCQFLYSQESYRVVYKITEPKMQGNMESLGEDGKQFFKKAFEYAKGLKYVLTTTQEESFFKLEDVLEKGDETPLEDILLKTAKRFTSFKNRVYIDINKNKIVFEKNLINKNFIVQRNQYIFNWKIKNATKKILGYNAKLATGEYYDEVVNKNKEVTAWFIPSIPIPIGPDIFMGLPGLIAEVEIEGAVVTMIEINSSKTLEIQKVDTSEAISQKDFNELIGGLNKKLNDIIDN